MNRAGLLRAGLRHHARAHALVLAGTAVGSAVLVGALLVGASVRATLRGTALERVGRVDVALVGGERFFRAGLAARLARAPGLEGGATSALVATRGTLSARGGEARIHAAQVFGVDETFFALAPPRDEDGGDAVRPLRAPRPGTLRLNERAAAELGVAPGDEIVLRLERPGSLPRDAVLATSDDVAAALRREVAAVLGPGDFGDFGLAATHVPEPAAFLARDDLQGELGTPGLANVLLVGAPGGAEEVAGAAERALEGAWTLADVGLVRRERAPAGAVELVSRRILLEEPIGEALAELDAPAVGALTWFVDSIEHGDRSTPYSVVAGVGAVTRAPPPPELAPVPAGLSGDAIVLNEWLAEDLGAEPGDRVTLRYRVVGADRRLVERSREMVVRSVVPLEGAAADPTWMPDFPGLADSEHCRDWDPGLPLDLGRLRERDEEYWREHRGTPKAFVSLEAARDMWATRFGDLTSVRARPADAPRLESALRERLDPESLGLFFHDARGPALRASAPTTDFGVLFLGLSSFLLAGAFLLTALFFALGVEQRAREVGTLLALGFPRKLVRRLFLAEAAAVAAAGALIGVPAGVGYTALVLRGLESIWSDAVGRVSIELALAPGPILSGAALTFVASLGAIAASLRRLFHRPAVRLLAADLAPPFRAPARARVARGIAVASAVLAAAVLALGWSRGGSAAGVFFAAGALALVAALAVCQEALARAGRRGARTRGALARSGAARRPGRSTATVACLASGVFLVVAVGVHRLGSAADPAARASGTGGFALYVETALPVLHDLESERGRDAYGIGADELEGARVVPMRVRSGDDASCLNLATPQRPRLVGVRPEELADRGAFSFADALPLDGAQGSRWSLLEADLDPGVVPGIADQASVTWTLHRSLGDDVEYRDERGRPFAVRIVATLAGSMLQGEVMIAESAFERRFPLESGHRAFLVDAPPARAEDVAAALRRGLGDLGARVTPAPQRLARFQAVQNTYIAIFQVLGALGVLLGCAGLGAVLLRNANERRAELAALRAIGFTRGALFRLVVLEHAWLVVLGVAAGAAAAAVALLPASRPEAPPAWGHAAVLAGAVVAAAALAVGAAAGAALRGDPLGELARE